MEHFFLPHQQVHGQCPPTASTYPLWHTNTPMMIQYSSFNMHLTWVNNPGIHTNSPGTPVHVNVPNSTWWKHHHSLLLLFAISYLPCCQSALPCAGQQVLFSVLLPSVLIASSLMRSYHILPHPLQAHTLHHQHSDRAVPGNVVWTLPQQTAWDNSLQAALCE